jgi:hypothetical protein
VGRVSLGICSRNLREASSWRILTLDLYFLVYYSFCCVLALPITHPFSLPLPLALARLRARYNMFYGLRR